MQPIFLQSLQDKFKFPTGTPPQTPANQGTISTKNEDKDASNKEMHTKYWSGIGKPNS